MPLEAEIDFKDQMVGICGEKDHIKTESQTGSEINKERLFTMQVE